MEGAEDMSGREAIRSKLRRLLPWVVFGLIIALLTPLLGNYRSSEDRGFAIFFIALFSLIPAGSVAWVLNSFLQKQEAGGLLLDVGRTRQNQLRVWIVLIWTASAVLLTWYFFKQVSTGGLSPSTSLSFEVSKLIAWWSLAILNLALALDKLEFRERGICYMLAFTAWQRVRSYHWEQSNPNILTLKLESPHLLSTRIMIPAKQREAVSHILNERLPDRL